MKKTDDDYYPKHSEQQVKGEQKRGQTQAKPEAQNLNPKFNESLSQQLTFHSMCTLYVLSQWKPYVQMYRYDIIAKGKAYIFEVRVGGISKHIKQSFSSCRDFRNNSYKLLHSLSDFFMKLYDKLFYGLL